MKSVRMFVEYAEKDKQEYKEMKRNGRSRYTLVRKYNLL